jgi:hypothetical protein
LRYVESPGRSERIEIFEVAGNRVFPMTYFVTGLIDYFLSIYFRSNYRGDSWRDDNGRNINNGIKNGSRPMLVFGSLPTCRTTELQNCLPC